MHGLYDIVKVWYGMFIMVYDIVPYKNGYMVFYAVLYGIVWYTIVWHW
jgi:hypothetical protein